MTSLFYLTLLPAFLSFQDLWFVFKIYCFTNYSLFCGCYIFVFLGLTCVGKTGLYINVARACNVFLTSSIYDLRMVYCVWRVTYIFLLALFLVGYCRIHVSFSPFMIPGSWWIWFFLSLRSFVICSLCVMWRIPFILHLFIFYNICYFLKWLFCHLVILCSYSLLTQLVSICRCMRYYLGGFLPWLFGYSSHLTWVFVVRHVRHCSTWNW